MNVALFLVWFVAWWLLVGLIICASWWTFIAVRDNARHRHVDPEPVVDQWPEGAAWSILLRDDPDAEADDR